MADRIVVMNHGVIEQVGTPEEIYRRPRTAFVADFVGKMSFFPGRVSGPGRVAIAGYELACADDRGMPAGSAVSLGLRPEEVKVRGVAPDEPNAVEAVVDDLEFLGSFYRARLLPGGEAVPITADFSANLMRDLAIRQGMRLHVVLPPEALRLFPAEAAAVLSAEAA
jgi:iron(III) transport system ATP-binding protein